MTCREFVDFLMAYLDDELEAELRDRFAEHLAECPPCERYLESYRRTVALGRSLCDGVGPDAPVPGEVPEELVRAILALRS